MRFMYIDLYDSFLLCSSSYTYAPSDYLAVAGLAY